MQYPPADVEDQPRFFRERNEIQGDPPGLCQRTSASCPQFVRSPGRPAGNGQNSCLSMARLSLVSEFEVLGCERRHALVVELELLAAAAMLGVGHGDVGVLDQLLDVLAVARVERDADAGGHGHVPAVDSHRLGQCVPDFLGDPGKLFRLADAFDDDREFVSPQPRDGVHLAQEALEGVGDDLQHAVAGHGPVSLICLAIEVEEHQGRPSLFAWRGHCLWAGRGVARGSRSARRLRRKQALLEALRSVMSSMMPSSG